MTDTIDNPWILYVGLGMLGLNVLCLLTLLVIRPVLRQMNDSLGLYSALSLHKFFQIFLAELLGTFATIFLAMLLLVHPPAFSTLGADLLVITLARGFLLAALLAGPGIISGGYFNPAVTVALCLTQRISLIRGLLHLIAQGIGAILAPLLLGYLFDFSVMAKAVPQGDPTLPLRTIFLLEAILAMIHMIVVACCHRQRGKNPLAVGMSFSACLLVITPFTGGSLNPVRYLAPALLVGESTPWLVYLVGPLVGCVLGAILTEFLHYTDKPQAVNEPPSPPQSLNERLAA